MNRTLLFPANECDPSELILMAKIKLCYEIKTIIQDAFVYRYSI